MEIFRSILVATRLNEEQTSYSFASFLETNTSTEQKNDEKCMKHIDYFDNFYLFYFSLFVA